MIPSVAACFELMDAHRMLPNIRAHSVVVAQVAAIVTEGLRETGVTLAQEKVIAGALLHDIGKTGCLANGLDHAKVGREICIREGYPEIADIVGEHIVLGNRPETQFGEREIVYYADKRVNHDQVVSLPERLQYILERYSPNNAVLQERIRANFKRCVRLERHLFSFLQFLPDQIPSLLSATSFSFLDLD